MVYGFAFVYMEDERDGEDAIRALDRIEFGRKGRRLCVEWTKQERSSRRPEISRKSSSNSRPSKTLFVINFDPYHTRTRDIERHFDPYGKILNVRIRRNFAFIQFESQENATKALQATNMTKLLDRIITVEYAIKDDDERRNGYSPDRARERSPRRGGYDRARSPSPYKRERESPDYGHGRARIPSPHRRDRASPEYARGRRSSQSPSNKGRDIKRSRGRSPSPRKERERESDHNKKNSSSPHRERSNGEISNGLSPRKKVSPDYGRGPSPSLSPKKEKKEKTVSPDDYARDPSPTCSDAESPPPNRYAK